MDESVHNDSIFTLHKTGYAYQNREYAPGVTSGFGYGLNDIITLSYDGKKQMFTFDKNFG